MAVCINLPEMFPRCVVEHEFSSLKLSNTMGSGDIAYNLLTSKCTVELPLPK